MDIFLNTKHSYNFIKLQDPQNLNDIKPYQAELEKERIEDLETTKNSVTEIRGELESLKNKVFNTYLKEPKHTDYLRKSMLDAESKISDLKKLLKHELIYLIKNAASLFKEIQFLERRLEEWSKPINTRTLKPVRPKSYKFQNGNPENPTAEFQKFLTSYGGHCGGWHEQDHLLFLRERKKYKGKEKFISIVASLLPDFSCEDIIEHENWYVKYEALKNAQKEAIQKWKAEKKSIVTEKVENTSDKREENPRKKAAHQRNVAERIKKWKEQQLARKIEEEQKQKEEKVKLQQEERRKKELQEMKKLAVSQYKAEKLNKLQVQTLQRGDKIQLFDSKEKKNVLLKSFRLQDLKFIEKKKTIRLQLESKANDKNERLKLTKPALDFILRRDPERIFQPTLIWSQHCRHEDKKQKSSPVFDLNSIPRLAIPEWRRELKF